VIKIERPPNYDKISAVFKLTGNEIFAYDGVIYAPKGGLTPELVLHENVHFRQQDLLGVDIWWDNYLTDKIFRLEQEIPAHLEEYHAFCGRHKDRNERVRYLHLVANRLSSKLYDNIITKQQALKILCQ
jgi:hypothetical protein